MGNQLKGTCRKLTQVDSLAAIALQVPINIVLATNVVYLSNAIATALRCGD
jgi:hypothetical protein